MKFCYSILITLCCCGCVLANNERDSDEANKPNILFILADDMSYEAIGAANRLDIDTPNLDRLARRSTTFTHAYNMGADRGAVCMASRAMLNSGRFLWQAVGLDPEQIKRDQGFWSQRMKHAGYRTYFSGKWHVKTDPRGVFDVVKNVRKGMPKQTPKGYNRPKGPEDYSSGWKPWDPKHGGYWEGGKHWSTIVGDDGIEFMETAAKQDQPFFMYLAFNAPHDPRQAPKEFVDRYPLNRIEVPESFLPQYPYADKICGLGLRDEKLMPYPRTKFSVKVNRQEYFAIITHMDQEIGRILDSLQQSGKSENTFVIFTADHGLAVGHHGLCGKQNMYDHSVRVPFMIAGPNIKEDNKITAPIYLQDAMATALELAGASLEGVDFKSVLPLIRGETAKTHEVIYGAYMKRQLMITQGHWKLIHYPTANVERLFNLKTDPLEIKDLAGDPQHADRLEQLRDALAKLNLEMKQKTASSNAEKVLSEAP